MPDRQNLNTPQTDNQDQSPTDPITEQLKQLAKATATAANELQNLANKHTEKPN